ncbi:hypothetical protein MMC26_004125 [Xylographa opegraphella]|nr:hypothetical protein [Xylographa opegraphella]
MDRASQVLAKVLCADEKSRSYRALADKSGVSHSTLQHRYRGRESKEAKAQRQQYLTPEEEKAMIKFLLLLSSLGHPVRKKVIPSLAFSIARRQSATNKPIKPSGKNWARGEKSQGEKSQGEKSQGEKSQGEKSQGEKSQGEKSQGEKSQGEKSQGEKSQGEKSQGEKSQGEKKWFQMVSMVLQDPAVLPDNVYNMDETGVMLSKLGSVKVLVGKDDFRDYRGAGFKRTMVTAIECISADADKVAVVLYAQDEVPQTPVTPITAEALILLHNLIKQDAHTLDKIRKQRLQKHVQKLASAARVSFAECALLKNQNQFLVKINNEAKVRRSTRSVVLGKAKVMSYKDLEEAQAKRAVKEKTSSGKKKRSRKRQSAEPEQGVPETETEVTRVSKVLESWRAPVARMY